MAVRRAFLSREGQEFRNIHEEDSSVWKDSKMIFRTAVIAAILASIMPQGDEKARK
jgi:hypothetical protein